MTFLASIDSVIHVEVYKLYPEAQLPKFEIIEHTPERLEMNYSSGRKMASFAFGLIEKTVEYYKEECSIKMKNLTEEGDVVNFIIKKIV
ncbi:MAG: heme NO-binding domain-containing protein [Saprospiraceae bacterium]